MCQQSSGVWRNRRRGRKIRAAGRGAGAIDIPAVVVGEDSDSRAEVGRGGRRGGKGEELIIGITFHLLKKRKGERLKGKKEEVGADKVDSIITIIIIALVISSKNYLNDVRRGTNANTQRQLPGMEYVIRKLAPRFNYEVLILNFPQGMNTLPSYKAETR